jgi:hypothetical protein
MDIEAIATWLKNTIPGIIILGALGSFAAGLILWIAKRLLAPFFGKAFVGLVTKVAGLLTAPVAEQQTKLYFKSGENKFLVYYTLHVMKLMFSLFFAGISFVVFILALVQPIESLLRPAIIVPLILFFLFFWSAIRAFMVVFVPHKIDLDGIIEKTKKQVLAKRNPNP